MAPATSSVLPDTPIESLVIGECPCTPVHAGDDTYAMPATEGQIRFWSLDQLNPGNPALNMPLMWQCTGDLNLKLLAVAFSRCIQRHESLRTTFALIEGRLSQIIHPPYPMQLPVVDLEPLQGQARKQEADRLTREHAAFRFDLANGPLLTLKLLRFDDRHHLLLVSMHHIICDGISNGILMRDMRVFYEASLTGAEPVLPELPIQFADYAIWHEQWLAGDEPAQSLDFWRKSLGDDFSRLTLKRDEDAEAELSARLAHSDAGSDMTGDIETLLIPAELQLRAHAFCKRENVTLNILLFTVFAALLNRLTGQRDLVIGSPCANRTEDTDELIGLFMNIQVMRLQLAEDETFRTLLRKVQDWTLGAYENQSLPFENLVHDPYFSNRSNSFEIPIFFLYQKSFMVTHTIGNLEIVPLRSESPGAVFEVMFAIVDRAEEGPRLQLEYNPHYFKVSTIQRYLRMFVSILESALDNAETRTEIPLDRLEVLTPAARTQLLEISNQTAVDFGPFEPVYVPFLARAQREPDRIALECNGVAWTCAQLASYASALAATLLAEGLQPGGLVAICVERSPQMVGAVLAVMMAGGAWVPLDPRHPKDRLQMVLDDSGATLLLTLRDLNLTTSAKPINIADLNAPLIAPLSYAMSGSTTTAADLAYVIYTSGSTGAPKGVAIEHGALLNLLRSMQRTPGLTGSDVLVAITTLAFDIAGLELLLPLLTGAKLVIATDAEVLDGRLLLNLIERSGATFLQATPGAWRILIDAGLNESRPSPIPLKALCGGEALPRDLANKLLQAFGENGAAELWNVYGPTETTIWSSATRITRTSGSVRIGPPIANTQFYLLDQHLQPTPIGVVGELFIGGAGLARGYWNRPELTAEKFIPDPFLRPQSETARIYATGDLGRFHDDGTIELLGRADFQVKIRGYRIELPEIEAAIMAHPNVQEAVVVAHKSDSTGTTRLIAYLAATQPDEHLTAELQLQLSRTLPDYLIPNAFVILPQLPRNTNGKINRKALPNPEGSPSDAWLHASSADLQDYVPPSDGIERQLADIWQTTLGIPLISVRASFFSLGVGSLAALRLITKMNRVYAMELGLASLISASTIESIALLIHKRVAPNTNSSIVPLQPSGSRPPLYILHGVGGNVVNFYGLAMRVGNDQPVYGIQSQALVANQPALLHLKDMAAHYVADIRKIQPHGPYHLLGYSFGGTVVLEMAHQLRAAGDEVALLGMIDSKSRDYEQELAHMTSVQTKINRRVNRFRGNASALGWSERIKYIHEKLSTRAIRFACMAAASLHMKRVPAFMRSAYDINYVAVQNYKLRPYDGRLVLFRASDQGEYLGYETGEYDLGWGSIFTQGVEILDLPGDHERIFLEPNIDKLAASLRTYLHD